MMTAMACGFMACCNSKVSSTEQSETEVTEIEQVVDTSDVETSNEGTRGESEKEGFGRCFESGCYCKEFKGRGETCRNCGHAYRRHY